MATNAVIQTVGAAGYVSLRVTQASHGLTGRVPVYYNTSTNLWTAAQANAGTTLGTHLAKVIDSNTLLIVQSGIFPDTSHGLTAGQYYFVSDSAAGTLTVTEPTAVGSFSNPMIYVTDANTYIVLGYRSSQTVNQSFNPLLNDGTAAAPSLAFSADTDTGFYRIGANTIGISTNGARVGEIGVGYGGFTGNIIQVQNTILTSTVTISHSTIDYAFKDITGLTVNITPRYSTSKILIYGYLHACTDQGYVCNNIRFLRDSTAILIGDAAGSRVRTGSSVNLLLSSWAQNISVISQMGIDSPATTSQITYKLQVNQTYTSSAGSILINKTTGDSDNAYIPRATSGIIVAEIQQ